MSAVANRTPKAEKERDDTYEDYASHYFNPSTLCICTEVYSLFFFFFNLRTKGYRTFYRQQKQMRAKNIVHNNNNDNGGGGGGDGDHGPVCNSHRTSRVRGS